VSDATPIGNPKPLQQGGVTCSVLIVDDDPAIRSIMSMVLKSAGYEVVCAVDGQEALKILGDGNFDLVITDMLMPGSDGLELLFAIKKNRPALRVLVMSGGGMIGVGDYLKVAKKLGAHEVLEKPFTGETLLAAVAKLLEPGA